MTSDEQKQLERLQDQLSSAHRNVEEVRAQFSSALVRSNTEARLYRGLFWCLLVMTGVATLIHILQK